ncbi:MAG: serine hydrolase [Bacteroidales bacterium]|nr:serine hydrolase [Bacteroidales bacterium]
MKKNQLALVSVLLFTIFFFISCKKESSGDPNKALIDKMKLAADSVIKNTPIPGLVALVVDHKRGINWLYAAGVSNKETKAPMNVNHTFRIASCTKTFTLTVLLQLVDERKVSLDDKLSKYYPEYPASDSITVLMLSNMTSGISDYFDDDRWQNSMKTTPLRVWAPQELVNMSFSHPLNFRPGTGYRYSNVNTIIIGMIIEKVTGNSLETEISNRIIKPLQLVNSGFITNGTTLPGTHGRGYDFGDLDLTGDLTESFDLSNCWAAGSVYTTPRELQLFVERMVNGGFLSDSLQYRRLNNDFHEISPIQSYGIGIYKLASFYGHNGIIWGYLTSMYYSPEKDCTVIIYYNLCQPSTHLPDNLFGKFLLILYGSYNNA